MRINLTFTPMSQIIYKNITSPFLERIAATNLSIKMGFFFLKGFSPELLPEPIVFKGFNNSEVSLSALLQKVIALCYISQRSTVNFSLKAKAGVLPTGGDTWV